jgi:hypothetical protein
MVWAVEVLAVPAVRKIDVHLEVRPELRRDGQRRRGVRDLVAGLLE